jgi:hypothetical protein
MTTKANTLFAELEKQRILLMTELSIYNDATLNKKPSPEAWSAVQVMQHLMGSEAGSLAYMKKKLSYTNKIPRAGFMSYVRRIGLSIIFALPLKFKAPKHIETFPDYANFDSLKNQWASQRLELQYFMDSIPDNMFKTTLWRHAVVGKMSITQMLSFFHSHTERHRGQIERTLRKVG